MAAISHVGRVMIPVRDQDAAIAFYRDKLGFTVATDVAFGENDRWVELATPNGKTNLALVPPHPNYDTGKMTGVALDSNDVKGDHQELKTAGVDVDEPMGGDGPVPLMFFFRDLDGNTLLLVENQDG